MNAYLKLTISILLIAFAIIGANFFIPHKLNSSVSSMKEVYLIVAIIGVSFLAGFYFLYNSIKEINKKKEINTH
jgi:hypothetical protein